MTRGTLLAEDYEAIATLKDALQSSFFRSLGNSIDALGAEFGDEYFRRFEDHLRLLRLAQPDRTWPAWAANGFISFSRMVLKEELAFKRTNEYSASAEDIDRVVRDVYDNAEIMNNYYLVGLYLTYFLWPHHYRMLCYYKGEFLGRDTGEVASFAEWGVGHGLLSLAALRRWPAARAALFDLSVHSLDFARRLLVASGDVARCSFVQGDVLAVGRELPPVDRLVCGEVLEHVPNPAAILRQARAALVPGGRAFFTAAVNAPQADHVYLFRADQEVFEMAAAADLAIRSHVSVVHPNRNAEANPPTVVGMVLEAA